MDVILGFALDLLKHLSLHFKVFDHLLDSHDIHIVRVRFLLHRLVLQVHNPRLHCDQTTVLLLNTVEQDLDFAVLMHLCLHSILFLQLVDDVVGLLDELVTLVALLLGPLDQLLQLAEPLVFRELVKEFIEVINPV